MSKPLLYFNKAITLDLSVTGSSAAVDISDISMFAAQEVYSAGATGVIIVEVSNDGVTFDSIDSNSISAAGHKMVPVAAAPYVFVRITYTKTSGSGSLTVFLSGKVPA